MALRREEEWARRIIEVHLGCPVSAHDDGSEPGMYDLRIGRASAPEAAIEVSAAVDEARTRTWNTGPARGSWTIPVKGDWMVTLAPEANIKMLRQKLHGLLEDLCAAGVTTFADFEMLEWRHPELHERVADLGVAEADEYEPNGTGTIHFTMAGTGGAVDSAGSSVPGWIEEFLSHGRRADVLHKLSGVAAARREVFIPVTMNGAPWSVVSYLTDISAQSFRVPSEAPKLPSPVTGVWVVSTMSFGEPIGVRWSSGSWEIFQSRGPGIDNGMEPGDDAARGQSDHAT